MFGRFGFWTGLLQKILHASIADTAVEGDNPKAKGLQVTIEQLIVEQHDYDGLLILTIWEPVHLPIPTPPYLLLKLSQPHLGTTEMSQGHDPCTSQ